MPNRYHVNLGGRVTTASLGKHLAGLLAVKLGHEPETPDGNRAVRDWLQARLDDANDPGRHKVSQWLQGEALLTVADKMLSDEYLNWFTR